MSLFDKLVVRTLPLVPKSVVRYFSRRYIAGEGLGDAVGVVRTLNEKNCMATMDVLGESVADRDLARRMLGESMHVLDAIRGEGLDSNLSIKLTQIGLDIGFDFTLGNVRELAEHAGALDNFIRIDMEDSSTTDRTLEIYRTVRGEFQNIGVAVQSYLRRTVNDVSQLVGERPSNFRVCKGIYVEPEKIAYQTRREINESFLRILEIIFESGSYAGIATHDEELVTGAYRLIEKYGLSPGQYEFQMLLGVRPELRDRILHNGHRMRIYVPFGKHWYRYSVRRLKENPKMAGAIFKSVFTRGDGT